MTEGRRSESLWRAYQTALVELGEKDPSTIVLGPEKSGTSGSPLFRDRFPERFFSCPLGDPSTISLAAGLTHEGHSVYVHSTASHVAGEAYTAVRTALCIPRANVKLVAGDGDPRAGGPPEAHSFPEDVGILRGLPGLTVLVPADGPSARGAILAVHAQEGPAYLRLARGDQPVVTDGSFQIGRAAELRAGGDLTIVAVGPLVARALDVAEALSKVGVATRVLDFASVKPFDEPALLRAARDTGAILVLEEHTVLTGIGALVASTTSENYPVPVRRIGVADVYLPTPESSERYALGIERIRDEAWELLQLRGKVT
ncbi:MAG: transketolase family protein [Thermoplasmata archaeon]|nr:transketolase family protein [Thermoplasmata archaeon]